MSQYEVKSELPGTFYRRPGPGEASYVEVGDHVTASTVIGMVELMKQFNEVAAGVDGVLRAFKVDHEQSIDADEVIALIEANGVGG